jgi:hypothetical protein
MVQYAIKRMNTLLFFLQADFSISSCMALISGYFCICESGEVLYILVYSLREGNTDFESMVEEH